MGFVLVNDAEGNNNKYLYNTGNMDSSFWIMRENYNQYDVSTSKCTNY